MWPLTYTHTGRLKKSSEHEDVLLALFPGSNQSGNCFARFSINGRISNSACVAGQPNIHIYEQYVGKNERMAWLSFELW